jgi:hypothetical protein
MHLHKGEPRARKEKSDGRAASKVEKNLGVEIEIENEPLQMAAGFKSLCLPSMVDELHDNSKKVGVSTTYEQAYKMHLYIFFW